MTLIERIHKYLEANSITPYRFERTIGVGNGYLIKQGQGKGAVGSEVLEKIYKAYPDLNIIWLLTGDGEMKIIPPGTHTHSAHPSAHPNEASGQNTGEIGANTDLIKTMEKLNDALTQQNTALTGSIADKSRIIQMLEEKLKAVKTVKK